MVNDCKKERHKTHKRRNRRADKRRKQVAPQLQTFISAVDISHDVAVLVFRDGPKCRSAEFAYLFLGERGGGRKIKRRHQLFKCKWREEPR